MEGEINYYLQDFFSHFCLRTVISVDKYRFSLTTFRSLSYSLNKVGAVRQKKEHLVQV